MVEATAARSSGGSAEFPGLVASFFTLSGAGFVEPPRNSFIERCEAAAAAGFSGIGLHFDDLPRTIAAGVDVPEMRAVLRNNGLALVEIEFLAGWAFNAGRQRGDLTIAGRHRSGRRRARGPPGQRRRIQRRHPAGHRGSAGPRGEGVARQRRSARRAGAAVALESFPWSALANTRIAIDLLRRADAPNAGLLIDVWHFYNGGGHPDQLVDLPTCRHHRRPTQRRPAGTRELPAACPCGTPTTR